MDVAFITTDMDVKGAVRRVVELSNHLMLRGHKVTVYTQEGDPCKWLPLKAPVLPRDGIGRHDALVCCGGGKLGHKLLRQADADVKALYVLGIGRNGATNRARTTRTLKKNGSSFARMVNSGTAMIANCTAIAEYFRDQGHACGVVNGGVNFETFHPRNRKHNWRVLWAGTRRRQTGTGDALDMMAILRSIEPRLYRRSYAYRGLSQDELAEEYSQAMCFLDTHHGGGWNNPVAEAMACGTAVVCTDIDGVQEFAFHEETALLVKPQDSWAMAKSVLRLAKEPELQNRLRTNALDHIAQFTWDRAAEQLELWLEEHL